MPCSINRILLKMAMVFLAYISLIFAELTRNYFFYIKNKKGSINCVIFQTAPADLQKIEYPLTTRQKLAIMRNLEKLVMEAIKDPEEVCASRKKYQISVRDSQNWTVIHVSATCFRLLSLWTLWCKADSSTTSLKPHRQNISIKRQE